MGNDQHEFPIPEPEPDDESTLAMIRRAAMQAPPVSALSLPELVDPWQCSWCKKWFCHLDEKDPSTFGKADPPSGFGAEGVKYCSVCQAMRQVIWRSPYFTKLVEEDSEKRKQNRGKLGPDGKYFGDSK